jgi:crotonobetainyl-CoA:carnitine CoA-transferase CaiB-like acyl-CoA transferase
MVETMLDKVKVLEYCHSVAGAYCAKQLADLGAEVIKIEKPLVGDKARRAGPFPDDIPHPEKSGLFLYVNTNKLGITLDPTVPTGREIFAELAKTSDIIIEDNPPGHMEHTKLGYEELQRLRPDIILTSITPFGQTGSYAYYKAYALNVYQSSGVGHITPEGYKNLDRPPLKQGKYVAEYHAGIGAALITVGALFSCMVTGHGQHIDFSMQEWEMDLLKPKWEMYTYEGFIPSRRTVVRQGHGMTPCKDGYVTILLLEEHQWLRFVELAGKPEWLTDERFLDPYRRAEHGNELGAVIADWAKDHTREEIYHQGQEMGVPVGIVNKPSDIYSSQQLSEREFFVEIDHPVAGRLSYPGTPYQLSGTRPAVRFSAPTLGQHNEEIYCKRLGYTREDLVTFHQACVI